MNSLGEQAKPTVKLNRRQSIIRVINSRSKGDHLPAQRHPMSVATEKCNKLGFFSGSPGNRKRCDGQEKSELPKRHTVSAEKAVASCAKVQSRS